MFEKAIQIILSEPPDLHYPSYYADLLRKADIPDTNVGKCSEIPNNSETIYRQAAIDAIRTCYDTETISMDNGNEYINYEDAVGGIEQLPSTGPDLRKYEYHYDHTDCIWYRSEARNRCPVTCAQYRDGWNDAMNYIFRDGKGYRPYRRGAQYEE